MGTVERFALDSSVDKGSACNAGDLGLILGLGWSPAEGNDYPLQYSCLENPMAKGSVAWGYSPWVSKESDTNERLTFYTPILQMRMLRTSKSICIPPVHIVSKQQLWVLHFSPSGSQALSLIFRLFCLSSQGKLDRFQLSRSCQWFWILQCPLYNKQFVMPSL